MPAVSLVGDMSLLFAVTEPAPAPAGTWTPFSKGDGSGSVTENSSSSLTINASGSNDEANIHGAYRSVASGDIELTGIIGSFSGYTENFTGFGIGLTEGLGDGEFFAQVWVPDVETPRGKHGTPPNYTTQTGVAGHRQTKLTYDDTAKEIKEWGSSDGVDWFQIGSTISKTLSYPILVYGFGTSHDVTQESIATISGLTIASSITVVEATPPSPDNRVGIIQELTSESATFNSHGSVVDGIALQTWDTSDNSYVSRASGGTWDSNWNSTRVNLFTEESIHGPDTDDAIRLRLEYDIPYTDEQNAPRDKLFWSPNGFSSGFDCDTEYWLSMAIIITSDYEIDGKFGRETLLQIHNDSTAPGMIAISIDSGKLRVRERLTATSTSGGTERVHVEQSVSTDKGEITYLTLNFRFNPFTTSTLIDASMGAKAQIGETLDGNVGKLKIWKSIAPGASCTSLDLGTVTNSGGSRADFLVTNIDGAPVGRVPDWKGGVSGLGSLLPEFGLYKPAWFDGEPFSTRPAIPHDGSTKTGPIVIYLAWLRWGDASSNFASVHPAQLAEPT